MNNMNNIHSKKCNVYNDSLPSWESPFNHMKYFWHNDPGILDGNQICCRRSSEQNSIQHPENRLNYQVLEVQIRPKRNEQNSVSVKDIEVIKPVPWRNIYPPPNNICDHCRVFRGVTEQYDRRQLNVINETENNTPYFSSAPETKKKLILKPRMSNNENDLVLKPSPQKNTILSSLRRMNPPILPLCECNYKFDNINDNKTKNKRHVFFSSDLEEIYSSSSYRLSSTLIADVNTPRSSKSIGTTFVNSDSSNSKSMIQTIPRWQPTLKIVDNNDSISKREIKAPYFSNQNNSHQYNNCRCFFDKTKSTLKNKLEPLRGTNKTVRKIKKAPQPIRTSLENIDRWKKETAEEARAEIFRGIRDASTEKRPEVNYKAEVVSLSADICGFCNQTLSPFGYCNVCLSSPLGIQLYPGE